jgi:hypothetical protein
MCKALGLRRNGEKGRERGEWGKRGRWIEGGKKGGREGREKEKKRERGRK